MCELREALIAFWRDEFPLIAFEGVVVGVPLAAALVILKFATGQ